MRKLTLTLSLGALALGGASAAFADHHGGKGAGPDANGDGVVTMEEAKAHGANMFGRMDANGDGVINAEDRTARQAQRFAMMDANGDGEVSLEEMQAAHQARRSKMQERGMAMRGEMFARADTDGSGGLSEAEMRAMHQARAGGMHAGMGDHDGGMKRGHDRGERGMAMLRRGDTDGDGNVTRAELEASVIARFNRADTDGSGTITAEERAAARSTMKEHMQHRHQGN